MVFNASKIPEFQGKDKEYIDSCMSYCIKRSYMAIPFFMVFIGFALSSYLWDFALVSYFYGIIGNHAKYLPMLVTFLGLHLIIMFFINIPFRWSVRKYEPEFQKTHNKKL